MHPLVIVQLILLSILTVIVRHWLDKVERGIVSYKRYNRMLFLSSIIALFLLWPLNPNPITLMCYGVIAGITFIFNISPQKNDSEKIRDDLRIWAGHTVLLTFGTGALALMIHDPDSIREVILLLGFVALVFYHMFLRSPK